MKNNRLSCLEITYQKHNQSSPFSPKLGWIGCAILQATSIPLSLFFCFNISIFIYFSKYKTIEIHARAFLPLNILAASSVWCIFGLRIKVMSWLPQTKWSMCSLPSFFCLFHLRKFWREAQHNGIKLFSRKKESKK